MRSWHRLTTVGLTALTAVALSSCGSPSSGTGWSTENATNGSDQAPEQVQEDRVRAATRLSPSLQPNSAMVDPGTWPGIDTILTREQITALFPEAGTASPKQDLFGPTTSAGSFGNGVTPTRTTAQWRFTPGSTDDDDDEGTSHLKLSIRAFGADSAVVKTWDQMRTTLRANNSSVNTFYQDGSYGTRRVAILGTVASIVASNGPDGVALWIDVDFDGGSDFAFLTDTNSAQEGGTANNDTPEARAVRTKIVPALARDLASLLPTT